MATRLLKKPRNTIISCDLFILDDLEELITDTADIGAIGGYLLPPQLTTHNSNYEIQDITTHLDKPRIQGPMACVSGQAHASLKPLHNNGIAGVILYPLNNPQGEYEWINAAWEFNLTPIIATDKSTPNSSDLIERVPWLSSGYYRDDARGEMYCLAAQMGVKDFLIPEEPGKYLSEITRYCRHPVLWSNERNTYDRHNRIVSSKELEDKDEQEIRKLLAA